MKAQTFLSKHHITMGCIEVAVNPNITDKEWKATHWRCIFRKPDADGKEHFAEIYYSMGSAHIGEPKPIDVINCIASDISSLEQSTSFDDWANGMGYDPDSRKAFRIYETIEEQRAKFKQFLGKEAFDEMITKVEWWE